MKAFYLISTIFLSVLFSCKTEKDCPAFESNDLKYFTYRTEDTLRFTNADSEVFEIYIDQIVTSESYSFECKDLYGICPCINYAEAKAQDSRTNESYVLLRMEQSDVSEVQMFFYHIMDFSFEFDFNNELPHIDEMPHLSYMGSFSVGGKFYQDVVKIIDYDSSSDRVSAVYFNQKNGILRIDEKASENVWEADF